jgi:oligosaccharide repeat unit polymerase
MFALLIAIYLSLFFAFALVSSKREGYWSPVTIFGISAFYYYLSVPFELYLRNEEIFTTYPSVCGVSPETRNAIGILAVLALIGFVAGHWSSGLGRLIAAADIARPARIPKSLAYAAIGVVLLLFILYRFTIFEQLAYDEANERRYNDPIFGYLTRLCLLLACLIAGILVQRRGMAKLPAFIIAALVVAWGLYTSDKDPLLKAAVALSAFLVGKRSRSIKHLYLYCGAAVVAIAALPVFSAFRAQAPLELRRNVAEFSVLNTDAKGPMMSLVSVLEDEHDKLYGQSYVFALAAWIPRSIWPDRPYDLAQEFAFQEIRNWQPGMGLGYSLLAESYLNFGYAGAFIQYFVLGYVLGRIWCWLYALLARRGALAYWRTMLTVTYFAILIIMHRLSSCYIPQTCIFELVIPIAAVCWFDARPKRAATNRYTTLTVSTAALARPMR